jgi:nitroreductase
MDLKSLIKKNRSYRRFIQSERIKMEILIGLIDLARLSASARNQQSLKYILSNEAGLNAQIFECLAWAGYLTDWNGPVEGERPAAYVVMLNDKHISPNHFCDEGIAAQSILLGAVELGLGGCIIGSVNRPKLKSILSIPDQYDIIQVLALGVPAEQVVIEEVKNGNIKYWRDENQMHHVPKRSLDEIIILIKEE